MVTLDEFRRTFPPPADADLVPVQALVPAGFETRAHQLELTWEQVADIAIAAVRRYLEEQGLAGDGARGGDAGRRGPARPRP